MVNNGEQEQPKQEPEEKPYDDAKSVEETLNAIKEGKIAREKKPRLFKPGHRTSNSARGRARPRKTKI